MEKNIKKLFSATLLLVLGGRSLGWNRFFSAFRRHLCAASSGGGLSGSQIRFFFFQNTVILPSKVQYIQYPHPITSYILNCSSRIVIYEYTPFPGPQMSHIHSIFHLQMPHIFNNPYKTSYIYSTAHPKRSDIFNCPPPNVLYIQFSNKKVRCIQLPPPK